jgi:hypothetical protein
MTARIILMPSKINDKIMDFTSTQWLYTFKDLVKPQVLEELDLEGVDYDHRLSSKLDGRRCLCRYVAGNLYVQFSNESRVIAVGGESAELYLDCEYTTELVVLDVLYCGTPCGQMPLEARMKLLPKFFRQQRYVHPADIKTLKVKEGYVLQRNSAPYGSEIYRTKYIETADFLVHQREIKMGPPCAMTFFVDFDLLPYEGKVIEIELETFKFVRVRPDKTESNSSVVIARCSAEYRVTPQGLEEKCLTIVKRDDDCRDTVVVNNYSVYEDSEYGSIVRDDHIAQDDAPWKRLCPVPKDIGKSSPREEQPSKTVKPQWRKVEVDDEVTPPDKVQEVIPENKQRGKLPPGAGTKHTPANKKKKKPVKYNNSKRKPK